MKKWAVGSFCVTNVICSIFICLIFIAYIVSTIIGEFNFDYRLLYVLVFILGIIIAFQRMFRVLGCYYDKKDNVICLNYITIKKRSEWSDCMAIGRRSSYSYQKEYSELSYSDIVSLDLVVNKKIDVLMWNKKELTIKLNNGNTIWMIKDIFSKKQLKEIILAIQEKNCNVQISKDLKEYLKLT